MNAYRFKTRQGFVWLLPGRKTGRYDVVFAGERLGSYGSAALAADDVGGGSVTSPSTGVDLSQLGIPRDLNEWEPVKLG